MRSVPAAGGADPRLLFRHLTERRRKPNLGNRRPGLRQVFPRRRQGSADRSDRSSEGFASRLL